MSEELRRLNEELNSIKKKIGVYTIIFIICCLTFIETIFYSNTVSQIISLIIGTISFILIERGRNRERRMRERLKELKYSLEEL